MPWMKILGVDNRAPSESHAHFPFSPESMEVSSADAVTLCRGIKDCTQPSSAGSLHQNVHNKRRSREGTGQTNKSSRYRSNPLRVPILSPKQNEWGPHHEDSTEDARTYRQTLGASLRLEKLLAQEAGAEGGAGDLMPPASSLAGEDAEPSRARRAQPPAAIPSPYSSSPEFHRPESQWSRLRAAHVPLNRDVIRTLTVLCIFWTRCFGASLT